MRLSNSFFLGPVVIQPERMAFAISSISSSFISARLNGIFLLSTVLVSSFFFLYNFYVVSL